MMRPRTGTIPARRFGSAEEFGDACAFLCSSQAGDLILLGSDAYSGRF